MRILYSLLVGFLICVETCGKPLPESDRKNAEELFLDAINAARALPREYAVIVRMQEVVLHKGEDVIESDTTYLYAERDQGSRYAAFGISNSRNGTVARRFWDQTLHYGLEQARRAGNPTASSFTNQVIENALVEPEKARVTRFLPEFYPYYFPLAQNVDLGARRINKLFGRYLQEHYEFIDERVVEGGKIESSWQVNKVVVKIWFDPAQNGRPVRIVRLGLPTGEKGERPIVAAQTIEWKEVKWDKRSTWVPIKLRRSAISNTRTQSDLVCYFQWKDTSAASVIPDVGDDDWREPIRAAFDEDWNLFFDDYIRNRASTAGIRQAE